MGIFQRGSDRTQRDQRAAEDVVDDDHDAAIYGDDWDPADRRPDWVISQEREERAQADADAAWAEHEQEPSGERYDRGPDTVIVVGPPREGKSTWRSWVAEADTDDDADC